MVDPKKLAKPVPIPSDWAVNPFLLCLALDLGIIDLIMALAS